MEPTCEADHLMLKLQCKNIFVDGLFKKIYYVSFHKSLEDASLMVLFRIEYFFDVNTENSSSHTVAVHSALKANECLFFALASKFYRV